MGSSGRGLAGGLGAGLGGWGFGGAGSGAWEQVGPALLPVGRRPPCGSSDPRRLLSLQNFLFHVYGLMLRESPGGDVVRKHLAGLLELSHASASQRAVRRRPGPAPGPPGRPLCPRPGALSPFTPGLCLGSIRPPSRPWVQAPQGAGPRRWVPPPARSRPSRPQGIALAVGIAAATHMELVWALLEHVGRTKFLRAPHTSSASQGERVSGGGAGGLGVSLTCSEPHAAHWEGVPLAQPPP